MALPTVAVEDIDAQIIASVELQIGQTIPLLPKAFVRVIAKALAAVIVLLYKYQNFTFLQMFVATAQNVATTVYGRTVIPLQAWGILVGAGLPTPATAAEHTVDFPVSNITLGTIDAGTQLVGESNGVTYLTTAAVLIDAATITVPVAAAGDQSGNAGVGVIGNLDPGAVVSFVTAPVGVSQAGAVATTTVTGADAESTGNYRQRVIDRFQKKPQGGALVDFEVWAEEAEGITHAYPYTGLCPGQVDVYTQATEASSGSVDGFPTPAQLDDVLDTIDLDDNGRASRRPVNAWVNAYSITRKSFTVEVNGLDDIADSVSVQNQINAGLASLFATFEPFIGGVTVYRRDRVTLAAVGGVVNSIVSANNGTFAAILLKTQPIITQNFTGRTVADDDDAEEQAGVMTVVAPSVTMGGADHLAGFRIPGANIPFGATLVSATLDFTSTALNNTYSKFTIRGEADVASAAYTAAANDISDRNLTVASQEWIPDGWAAASLNQTPDIAAVVQEIIDIVGWSTGGALNFVVTGTDDSDRDVDTFEGGLPDAPLLTLSYTIEAPTFASIQTYTLARGEKARLDSVSFT